MLYHSKHKTPENLIKALDKRIEEKIDCCNSILDNINKYEHNEGESRTRDSDISEDAREVSE
jgi:hypothetical protein